MYYIEGDDIYTEDIPLQKGKKIITYLDKRGENKYVEYVKCFGSHFLEQIFDEKGNLIEETIKVNPHKKDIDWSKMIDDEYD